MKIVHGGLARGGEEVTEYAGPWYVQYSFFLAVIHLRQSARPRPVTSRASADDRTILLCFDG